MKSTRERKLRRRKKARAKLIAPGLPRVAIYRSNKYIYAQVIDDTKGVTVAAIWTKKSAEGTKNKVAHAKAAGQTLAKKLGELKIKRVVFDRGGYKYGGRVAAFSQGLKEGGITI